MENHDSMPPKQFTFLDENRRQVIFTPKKYDPKTGQLIGVNQQGKTIAVAVKDFMMPYKPVELEWD